LGSPILGVLNVTSKIHEVCNVHWRWFLSASSNSTLYKLIIVTFQQRLFTSINLWELTHTICIENDKAKDTFHTQDLLTHLFYVRLKWKSSNKSAQRAPKVSLKYKFGSPTSPFIPMAPTRITIHNILIVNVKGHFHENKKIPPSPFRITSTY
jgi:hypothetical protein